MKILFNTGLAKNMKTDSTLKFLKERHDSYVQRQLSCPKSLRNPLPQRVSLLQDVLTLIGALQINRPKLK